MPIRSLWSTLLLVLAISSAALTARAQENTDPDTNAAPSSTSSTLLAAGWRAYEQPSDGYVLTLPPTWRRMDLDAATLAASVDAASLDAATAAWLRQTAAALIASQVSFFGVDFDPASMRSGFATNVNVIHSQLPGSIPLNTVVQISVAQLEQLPGVSGLDHHPISIAAGEGEQFNYHLQFGGQDLSTTQYVIVRGTDSYVVTLTTSAEQATSYAETFDQIAKSFELLG